MHATETSLPLVSIIMPAFNGEPYIGAAIRSVLAQSYARWELLILDDGSADRTAEIAEAFEKSARSMPAVPRAAAWPTPSATA